MSRQWFYTQDNERQGPVSAAELKQLAATGKLSRQDLVWAEGMGDWKPAGRMKGLFEGAAITAPESAAPVSPAAVSAAAVLPNADDDEDSLPFAPRHILTAIGGFVAALGIAFTAVAQSPLALALTVGGLTLAILSLFVEIGRLLSQAASNLGYGMRAMAEKREQAKQLALTKSQLAAEAREEAAREAAAASAATAAATPAAALAPLAPLPPGSGQPAATPALPAGNVVVVNHPPIQKWSPGVAAVLSFFVPGLGQLYKGQIINGIVWFLFVGLGYLALILPGLILHLLCIVGAASGNPWTEGKTTVVRE
jgi:hypothetical protein